MPLACRTRRAESAKVLQAWLSAEGFDIEKLVKYTDAYENKILRQRVGYLLEKLGRTILGSKNGGMDCNGGGR